MTERTDTSSLTSAGPVDREPRRLAAAALPVLWVLTVIIVGRGLTDGGFRYPDASRHAMDGALVHDFVADLPASAAHPLDYALEYYAHYPALGFGLYYPPLFAVVESAFFAVFGLSAATARLTVLAFAVLAVTLLYKLVAAMADWRAAFLTAAMFISVPLVVLWSRMAMLEMPATAMILAATYAFWKYVEGSPRPRWAIAAALLCVAAVMTKQTALFILPAFITYTLIRRRRDLWRRWEVWTGVAIVLVGVVPYFAYSLTHVHYLTKDVGAGGLGGRVGNTVMAWAEMFTTPGLILVVVAVATCMIWPKIRRQFGGLWLCVLLAGWYFVESVYVRATMGRYAFFAVPFLIAPVAILLTGAGLLRRRVVFGAATAAVLVVAVMAVRQPIRHVTGYEAATAAMLAAAGDSPFVLFDGYYDGDVVFYTRRFDPQRQRYMLRGSKMLYTFASFKQFEYQELIRSPGQLSEFLRHYGIRVVAVEDRDIVDTPISAMLRDTLETSDQFDLIGSLPIVAPHSKLGGLNVLMYQVVGAGAATAEELNIPLPGLRRTLAVTLNPGGGGTTTWSQSE